MATVDRYDPASNLWSPMASLAAGRYAHTATLLLNGQVLVVGGYGAGYTTGAELCNPQTNAWHAAGALAAGRVYHTTTLLPSGKVLVAGSYNGTTLASAELGDPGYPAASRPAIVFTSFLANKKLRLTGTGYTGDSEASGGTTENTATNHPVVTLRRLDNEALFFSTRPAVAFSSTQFLSKSFADLPKGW